MVASTGSVDVFARVNRADEPRQVQSRFGSPARNSARYQWHDCVSLIITLHIFWIGTLLVTLHIDVCLLSQRRLRFVA